MVPDHPHTRPYLQQQQQQQLRTQTTGLYSQLLVAGLGVVPVTSHEYYSIRT